MDNFKNKTVLVTGATGLIGSNLVHKLMESNLTKVVVLARNKEKILNIFSDYLKYPNFKYIIQDITEPIKSQEKFDYIFHAAGSIAGDAIRNYPVDVINANIQGTVNCLEYLKQKKHGRLIIFSSATVYGNATGKNITVTEADTTHTDSLDNPICAYSQSKRMAETLARAYHTQHNIDIVIARFSYVFGYTKYYPNTAIFNFIQKALKGEDIILTGTLFARRDNIYVEDAINMLLSVASNGNSGEAYNISSNGKSDNFAAIDEIAEEIVKSANKIKKTSVSVIKKQFPDEQREAGLILDNHKTLAITKLKEEDITNLSVAVSQTVHKYNVYLKKLQERATDINKQ